MSHVKLREFFNQNRKRWLQEVLITEIMKTRITLIQMSVFGGSFSIKLFQGEDGVPGEDGRKVIKRVLLEACVWILLECSIISLFTSDLPSFTGR